jgi:hypothetical protein
VYFEFGNIGMKGFVEDFLSWHHCGIFVDSLFPDCDISKEPYAQILSASVS